MFSIHLQKHETSSSACFRRSLTSLCSAECVLPRVDLHASCDSTAKGVIQTTMQVVGSEFHTCDCGSGYYGKPTIRMQDSTDVPISWNTANVCQPCFVFSPETNIAICEQCTDETANSCTRVTCRPGYHSPDLHARKCTPVGSDAGVACRDSVVSPLGAQVKPKTCTSCTSAAPTSCSVAECKSGFFRL